MTLERVVDTRPSYAVGALRVRPVTDSMAEWDRFAGLAPESTFCHQSGWRDIMADVLGHECLYLAACDEAGAWHGVLPLVRVRSLLGHYLISLPFLNDGGPVGDAAAAAALADHAVAEAERSGAKLLELRARKAVPGTSRVQPTHRKITVKLPLPESVEALWERTFRAKLRSQIRRPIKEGMTARFGATELAPFYEVFARNMRDLGTPVLPRRFFERLGSAFGDGVIFHTVYTAEGVPAAAACSLAWRDEVEIMWASSLREFNKLSPNMLLYARLMEECIGRGAKLFNFGRCTPGSATHKFKQQWGGEDVDLPWPTWSRDQSPAAPASPDRPIFRLATAAWSRLPLPIANRIGPVLARHLP